MLGGDHPGQDTGPRGRTDRRYAKEIRKANPFLGQPIQIRGQNLIVSGTAQRPYALIVGEDEKDIGVFLCWITQLITYKKALLRYCPIGLFESSEIVSEQP
jgi:hypothetical protein